MTVAAGKMTGMLQMTTVARVVAAPVHGSHESDAVIATMSVSSGKELMVGTAGGGGRWGRRSMMKVMSPRG